MDWYFAESNQQFGPVPPEQFQRLVSEGRIRASTLVWADGMANWLPYQQVYAQQVAQQDSALGADPAAGAALDPATGQAAQAVAPAWGFCCQCGRMYQTEDMIAFESHWVCAECKPLFFQRIREGVPPDAAAMGLQQGIVRYAGFWIRFAAWIIDYIALQIVSVATNLLTVPVLIGSNSRGGAAVAVQLLAVLVVLTFAIVYKTVMVGKYGATLGKLACGLRVVTAEGGKVTYLRAFARFWAELLSQLTIYIGHIIAGFDSEKRALHDHICKTRVIWK
ncbi:MAG TPA: RDD family protein [Phycisphaerae bacterium]|nr:RDD family protein [Phycisphaerae bacterium]HUU21284.1 RDD family protein [Phycisphaerae bacterium]